MTDALQSHFGRAAPPLPVKKRSDYDNRLRLNDFERVGWVSGPLTRLRAACDVPDTHDRNSCAASSALRVLALLHDAADEAAFGLPCTDRTTDVGPLPNEVCAYLQQCLPPHLRARLVETANAAEAQQSLRRLLRQGLPALCLLTFEGFSMHYVTAVGWNAGKIAFLNANGGIYWLPEKEFLRQMNSHASTLHRLRRIRPYNVVCFTDENRSALLGANSLGFDDYFYRSVHDDLAAAGNLRTHFLAHGLREGRCAAPWFNALDYLRFNPDLVHLSLVGAGLHYLNDGVYEGRAGSKYFDPTYYLDNNPDVRAAVGANNCVGALIHWRTSGICEGRQGSSRFAQTWYASKQGHTLMQSMIADQRSRHSRRRAS